MSELPEPDNTNTIVESPIQPPHPGATMLTRRQLIRAAGAAAVASALAACTPQPEIVASKDSLTALQEQMRWHDYQNAQPSDKLAILSDRGRFMSSEYRGGKSLPTIIFHGKTYQFRTDSAGEFDFFTINGKSVTYPDVPFAQVPIRTELLDLSTSDTRRSMVIYDSTAKRVFQGFINGLNAEDRSGLEKLFVQTNLDGTISQQFLHLICAPQISPSQLPKLSGTYANQPTYDYALNDIAGLNTGSFAMVLGKKTGTRLIRSDIFLHLPLIKSYAAGMQVSPASFLLGALANETTNLAQSIVNVREGRSEDAKSAYEAASTMQHILTMCTNELSLPNPIITRTSFIDKLAAKISNI